MKLDFKKACAKELEELKKHISPADKKAATDSKLVSRPTLDQYFRGEIIKIDTAMKMIKFFKKRIEERKRQLAA
jgi:hypothetical protein